MKEKCYPFSVKNHQHDIELRSNRVRNEMWEMEQGNIKWNDEWYEKATALSEDLDKIRDYVFGSYPIAYIPASLYGLAIDTVAWANEARSYKNKKRG